VTPQERDRAADEALRKLRTAGYLGLGSVLLAILAFALHPLGVPWKASGLYALIALVGDMIAFFLGVPWKEMPDDLKIDPQAPPKAKAEEPIERTVARFLTKRLANLKTSGIDPSLWVPFGIVLFAVGVLIQLSGGIVHSPFAQVAAVVLTLVVLLIRPPLRSTSRHGARGSIVALVVISFVFLLGMIVLECIPQFRSATRPAPGAAIIVSVVTTVVGVGLATWSRWSYITGKVPSE
jgi:hypothetical protein